MNDSGFESDLSENRKICTSVKVDNESVFLPFNRQCAFYLGDYSFVAMPWGNRFKIKELKKEFEPIRMAIPSKKHKKHNDDNTGLNAVFPTGIRFLVT